MEYSLDELVRETGTPVDTIRYYQTRGLLPKPGREGRNAVYEEEHVDRLRLIRQLSAKGLPLKVIGTLLERDDAGSGGDRALLAALEEEVREPAYSSAEVAREIGVPHAVLTAVEKAGLAEPSEGADPDRPYSESDVRVARGATRLLGRGLPLVSLVRLAVEHDRRMRKSVDRAIDLFDDHVRKGRKGSSDDDVAEAFRELLPVVTSLVAHHFQRLLVSRALRRLRRSGEKTALSRAVEVASRNRLRIRWR